MLKSMTGFARSDGSHESVAWHWEVRTINGRSLDIRLRLPPGFESLEQRARDLCKEAFVRGSCNAVLTVQRDLGAGQIRLNEQVLRQVAAAMARARELVDAAPPSLDGLLGIKGVLEVGEGEADETAAASVSEAIVQDLTRVLDQVREARAAEGARLQLAIAGHVDEIERLAAKARSSPGRTAEAIRERLREQVSRLLEEAPRLDEQRLYQEAVLLATKADIHEELDRLQAHVAAARDLLASSEAVGRQLEFLAQEFNRECNTICAKANDRDISQTGLAMKTVVDRLREQVQNIE